MSSFPAHPGGEAQTLRFLSLAEQLGTLPSGCRILDLGAGDGTTVRLLRERGFEIVGLDLKPAGEGVLKGDLLHTGFPDASFDCVISECAFWRSGDQRTAISEAGRILKPGGCLLLADVFFEDPDLPGFRILSREDRTPAWREYYLSALWREDLPEDLFGCGCAPAKGNCRYWMLIAKKEDRNGSV